MQTETQSPFHATAVAMDTDLVREVREAMQRAGFSDVNINKFMQLRRAQQAINLDPVTQLMYLTLAFNDIFTNAPTVPPQVRIALNYSKHPSSWMQDIQAGVLPFIKLNERIFFQA